MRRESHHNGTGLYGDGDLVERDPSFLFRVRRMIRPAVRLLVLFSMHTLRLLFVHSYPRLFIRHTPGFIHQVHQFSSRRLLVLIPRQDYAGILPRKELLRIEYTGASGQHS